MKEKFRKAVSSLNEIGWHLLGFVVVIVAICFAYYGLFRLAVMAAREGCS